MDTNKLFISFEEMFFVGLLVGLAFGFIAGILLRRIIAILNDADEYEDFASSCCDSGVYGKYVDACCKCGQKCIAVKINRE